MKSVIERIEEYKPPVENRLGNTRLDFNENSLGPSKKVKELLESIRLEELSMYPTYGELKKRLAEYSGVYEENIIATNGSDEAIDLVMRCFVERGAKVVIPSPSFKMFYIYAQAAEAKIKKVPYEKDFGFPTEKVLNEIDDGTSLVVLCNPNNPTGTIIPKEDIERILEKAVGADCFVLVDEAYYEFSGESVVDLLEKYENLIITRTFSKAFGLAGIRLGYLLTGKENVEVIERMKSPYNVSRLTAKIGCCALEDVEYVRDYVSEVREAKKELERFFEEREIKTVASEANFILVEFGKRKNFVFRQLMNEKILVRDVSKQEMLKEYLRVSVGTKRQTGELIDKLRKILDKPLLVFDLDGTLIDVSNSYRKAIKETVKEFSGKTVCDEEIQELRDTGNFNNDWKLSAELLIRRSKGVSFEKIKKKFQEIYLGNDFDGVILNEKLFVERKKLEKLAEEYCLAVLTGRPREEALFALKRFGVLDLFSDLVCLEDVKGELKPNGFGLELVRERFKCKDLVYFGDSKEDELCAENADAEFVGVNKMRKWFDEKGFC